MNGLATEGGPASRPAEPSRENLHLRSNHYLERFVHDDMAAELLRRVEADQKIRHRLTEVQALNGGQVPPNDPVLTELETIDSDNFRWFQDLIEAVGWPLISQVGQEPAQAAWLLAQHAPDQDFQDRCLGLMRDAVQHGEADPKLLAYLEDRVNVHHGRPQRYGTQWARKDDGSLVLSELVDPARVDEWRSSIGLGPVETTRPS